MPALRRRSAQISPYFVLAKVPYLTSTARNSASVSALLAGMRRRRRRRGER
jgi:hypothetical protein